MMKRLFLAAAMLCASLTSRAQITVAPILQPHQTFVDASGSPCSGCKLYSYTAGTTTPTPTYSDAGGTPNTNPIILNVQGGSNIWVDDSISYKFILKDAQGTTIWSVDDVKFPAPPDPPPPPVLDCATLGCVATNPAASQNVAQPLGTTLNVNNFNGATMLPIFGLDPTGNTNNSSPINAAIAANPKGLVLPPGNFFMGASYTNIYGTPFFGNGNLLQTVSQVATDGSGNTVTANKQQINSYSDVNQYIIGREHLTHFERSIGFSGMISYTPSKVTFSGDSTTAGVNITDPAFLPDRLFGQSAANKGLIGVSTFNAGHSGATSSQWLSTFLPADLATNPDCYIMRWGINDGSQGISPQQTIANMRAGLAQIRATKNVDAITLVLMMPSSTNDGPNGRDQAFYEQLRNGFVQAARDYQAVFVDTYAYLRDSNSAISSMDAPYTGVGVSTPVIHIHPDNYRNVLINSITVDALLPSGYQQFATNNFINIPSGQGVLSGSELPNTFPKGISIFRAAGSISGGTFPYDGYVSTEVSADYGGIGHAQFNWPYAASGTSKFAVRVSNANTWLAWKYFDDDVVAVGGGTDPKPPNSAFMDSFGGFARIVGVGANTGSVSDAQILGANSDQTTVDPYIVCQHSGSCTVSRPIAGPGYTGAGNAAACFNAAGQLYRSTGTSCP